MGLQRDPSGVLYMHIRNSANSSEDEVIEMQNEYGIKDYDKKEHKAHIVQYTSDGMRLNEINPFEGWPLK